MSTISGTPSGAYLPTKPRLPDAGAQPSEGGVADRAGAAGAERAQPGAASIQPAPGLDPSRIRSRIDVLIDGQVATGSLTGDQAGVLRQVLGSDGTDDPAPDRPAAATAPAASAPEDARPSPSETLAAFIQQLQRGQSRTVGYASDGSKGSTQLTSSRLLDFNT